MPLGNFPFGRVASDALAIIGQNGIAASLRRVTGQTAYTPMGTAQPTQATITFQFALVKDQPDELQTLAGGRVKEVLEGLVAPGTVLLNDQITWNGLPYLVTGVFPYELGGVMAAQKFHAERAVVPGA